MRILSARHALALTLLLALTGCTSSSSNSSWWKSNPFKSASTAPPSPYPVKPSQQYAGTANPNPSASLNSASPATPTGVPPVGATASRGSNSSGNPFGAASPATQNSPFPNAGPTSRAPSGAVAADGSMAPQRGMYEIPAGYNAPSQSTASTPPPGPSMNAFAPPSSGGSPDAPSYRTATTPRYDTPSNRYGATPPTGASTPDRFATPPDRYTTPFDRNATSPGRVPSYSTPDSRSSLPPASNYTVPSGSNMPSGYDPARSPRTDFGTPAMPNGAATTPGATGAQPYGPASDYRPSTNFTNPAPSDYRNDAGGASNSPYRMPSGPSSPSPAPSGYTFPTSSTSLPSTRGDEPPPYRPGSVGTASSSSNLAGPRAGASTGATGTLDSRIDGGVTPAGYTPSTAGLPSSASRF